MEDTISQSKIISDGYTSSKEMMTSEGIRSGQGGGHGRNLGSGRGVLKVNQKLPHCSLSWARPGAALACWGLSLPLWATGTGTGDLPHHHGAALESEPV